VALDVQGETIELAPEEVVVQTVPLEGLAVSADRFATVAVDAVITPALRSEGLAREIVRRIQDMRKNAGFNFEDRIVTTYQAEGELEQVFADWKDYLCSETLTVELSSSRPQEGAFTEEHKLEGMTVLIGVKQR